MANNKLIAGLSVLLLFLTSLGCSMVQKLSKANLFEGDNAAKIAKQIKQKIGSDKVDVIRASIDQDEMSVTVRSPKNPKDIDTYKYENGTVSGPEPERVLNLGPGMEYTADKMPTTNFDDIAFDKVPEAIKKAVQLSGIEGGKPSISMDNDKESTDPAIKAEVKEIDKRVYEKYQACKKGGGEEKACIQEIEPMRNEAHRKKFTFRWIIRVDGPRGSRQFEADKNGELNETPAR